MPIQGSTRAQRSDMLGNAMDAQSNDPKSLHNLLRWIFVGHGKSRGEVALAQRHGCDFSLISGGVQFDVHFAGFLLGGAKAIEEHIHPGGVERHPPEVTYVFNEGRDSPIMVDRFVDFIYTNTYDLDKNGRANTLRHATYIPVGSTKDSYAMEIKTPIHFHLKMYNMGERLRYADLMTVAHKKLADCLLWRSRIPPNLLLQVLSWVYGASSSKMVKICIDQDGTLRNLIMACTLRQLHKQLWRVEEVKYFAAHTNAYMDFRRDLRMAKGTYKDILNSPKTTGNTRKRKKRS